MKSTKINIYDLYRNINEVKEKKHTSYNEVLVIIHDRIKKASLKEKYKLLYEVPEYLFGVPSYNLNKCLAYIMKELRANGFLVKYYFPKILYISWDPVEITNYKKEKKLYQKKFKNMENERLKISNSSINYNKNNRNSNENNFEVSNNLDNYFQNQNSLTDPTSTQHTSSIFKPILNYDPNTIPTYNYYAYSTLNNNLVNEDFYITNGNSGNNGNSSYDTDRAYLNTPQHLKKVQLIKDTKEKEMERHENYQRDIMDYYKEEEPQNPFKNSIKKHNSNGKFILDLS